jgi:hypothetical protein
VAGEGVPVVVEVRILGVTTFKAVAVVAVPGNVLSISPSRSLGISLLQWAQEGSAGLVVAII